jgi:flagellar basal body-associated protein FliL
MSKKQLITIITILVVAIIGLIIVFYLNTFKTVRFDIKHDDITITVYSGSASNNQKVGSLDTSGELTLQAGNYTVVPSGDKYNNVAISFIVKNSDTTITINPEYSQAYREAVLKAEMDAINKVISDAYPSAITGFVINPGYIYENGTWYATTLTQNIDHPAEVSDVYRTVLKKEDGKWVIKAKPALVLSSKDYPQIPIDILRDINRK